MRVILSLVGICSLALALAACGDDPGATPAAEKRAEPRTKTLPIDGREGAGVLDVLPGDARDVLEQAERLELLALHPHPHEDDGKPESPAAGFHDYKVLGRADVTDPADRRALITALYQAINENEGVAADCFNPRHGLRAVKGDRTVDLVICFECLTLDGHGADPGKQTHGYLTESAEPAFDNLQKKLGLRLVR